jgi:ABC-type cobalamin/Fe3+-siderophores transport system ATPase subunit
VRTLTIPLFVVFTAVLAGCGSSDNGVAAKSASEILTASKTAASNANSVQIIGKNGAGRASLALNMYLANNSAHGQIDLFGLSFEVIRTGDTLYVKGNPTFANRLSTTTGLHIPPNTWLKGSTHNGALAQLGGLTEPHNELARILSTLDPPQKGARVRINGQPTIELKQTKPDTSTLYIATTGQPYPLQIIKHGQETGKTTFTNWNQHITITPPPNPIDITQLPKTSN